MLDKIQEIMIKLRLVSMTLIIFVAVLVWQMWGFYQANHTTMELSSSGAFSLAWMALIALLGKCLNHLLESNKKDEQ